MKVGPQDRAVAARQTYDGSRGNIDGSTAFLLWRLLDKKD
jgi:hypothetical protein